MAYIQVYAILSNDNLLIQHRISSLLDVLHGFHRPHLARLLHSQKLGNSRRHLGRGEGVPELRSGGFKSLATRSLSAGAASDTW